MYDLTNFTLRDMTACGAALRMLGPEANSMEEAATRTVQYFHNNLRDGRTGAKATALVRLFQTVAYGELDTDLRGHALQALAGHPESPAMKCLALLGTAGVKPEWNSRKCSVGHQAIPLPSAEMVVRSPMISQLLHQLGVEVTTLLRRDPALLVDLEQKTYNIFHVPEARGSPYVPAQEDFVIPYGIRSVVGFGGILPSGNFFAVILFTTVTVTRETADLFRPLALSVKLALLPLVRQAVFASAVS